MGMPPFIKKKVDAKAAESESASESTDSEAESTDSESAESESESSDNALALWAKKKTAK